MVNQDPSVPGAQHEQTAPPRPQWSRKNLIVAAIAAICILGIGIALGVGATALFSGDEDSSPGTTDRAATQSVRDRERTTTQAPRPIRPEDFAIEVLITNKQCFGSAGCSIQFSINPTFKGTLADLTGRRMTVIYDVLGGEDPQTGSFTLEGDNMSLRNGSIQTTTSDAVVTAVPTRIVER